MKFEILKNRRVKIGGIAIVLFLVVYALVGFFAVPWILNSRVLPQVGEKVGCSLSAQEIKFNPFTLSLTVNGFSMNEQDGAPLFGFDQFFVNFQASSLFRLAFVFAEIRLDGPWVNVVIDKDGKLNLAGLAPPSNQAEEIQPEEKTGIPSIIIDLLSVGRGRLDYKDFTRSTPFETKLSPITFHIHRFTTEPTRESPFEFTASFGDGTQVLWG